MHHYSYAPGAIHPLAEPFLSEIIQGSVSGPGPEVTAAVTKKLLKMIEEQNGHMTSQLTFGVFLSTLQNNARDLINIDSKDTRCKIAGLALLDCLLDANYNDEIVSERRADISRMLQSLFKNVKFTVETGEKMLRVAAQCVGHLAKAASPAELESLTVTYVGVANELVKDVRSDVNRLIGVLLLNQLAMLAPYFIFQKRHGVLSDLWTLLCDKASSVREAAAEALESTLILIAQRGALPEHLVQALKQVETGFSSSRVEKLVGSLLILDIVASGTAVTAAELTEATKKVFSPKDDGMDVDELIWKVLMWKDYAEMDLRQRVVKLIPKLAVTFSNAFLQFNEHTQSSYLQYTVKYLLDTIKLKKDRGIAYISLGRLFVAMSSSLRTNVDEVFASINEGFKDPFCPAALECLGMVVGISPPFRVLVTSAVVDSVFHGGLTKDLIAALEIVFVHIPAVRRHIQTRLATDVTYVLQSHSVVLDEGNAMYRTVHSASDHAATKSSRAAPNWGSPSKGIIRAIKGSKQQIFSISPFTPKSEVKAASGEDVLELALGVLASTLFFPRQLDPSVHLLRICYEYVVRFQDDYSAKIRSAAAATCIAVIDKATSAVEAETDLALLVPKIIDSLMMLGVGDDSVEIRIKVFSSLTPSVDAYIARSDCIHCLIDALNDESPPVRAAAVSVLTRAAHYDAVHIMPIVLLSLRELLNTLQTSIDHAVLHSSVKQLQSLVKGLGSYIVPYAKQVLKPLLDLLSNSSYEIAGEVLSTIGEVAIACPDLIRSEHLDELFPSLIQALQDSSSISKQETAVIALGKLVTSLHMVNEPYTKYPGLFEGLVSAIQQQSQEAAELRQQAMKTAGLLGALEVSMFEKYMRAKSGANVFAHDLEPDRDGADEETLSKVPDEESLGRLDRYYLAVVVKALMKVLREPTQTMHHQTAINITTRIIRNLGRRSHYQADEVIDAIFDRLEASAPGVGSMHNSLIDLLITLISSAGSHLSKHYPDIIKFVCDNFAQHQQSSLLIIEALHNGISAQDFVYVIREIIPVLVSTIEHEPLQSAENGDFSSRSLMSSGPHLSGRLEEETRKSLPRSGQIIRTLLRIADGLEDYKGVLIPVLLGIVSDTSVISQRRTEALRALMYLVRDVELNQLVGRIVHPLVRLLDSSQLDLVEAALTSLSTLACRLGKSYEPFIVPVRRKMRVLSAKDATMRLPQLEEYETIIALIMKGRPLPPLPESAASILPELDEKKFSMTPMKHLNESLPISMPMLETAWTLQTSRSGTSDFVEWYRRLTFEFIRQSPTSIIRQCTGLAKNYRPLAQDLLNASFISLWDSVASEAIATNVVVNVPLIEAFEKALKDSNIPNNITNAILNLAEFMDLQDKMLPFDIPLLAQNAGSRSGMLAKCVRYSEMEFRALNVPPTPECVESLITVYHQLGYQDSAVGLITCVKERHSERIPMKADWLEKLNRYDDARAQYESENKNWETIFNDDSPPLGDLWLRRELGILRCLNHLGNFEELEHNALRLRRYIRDVEQVEEKAMWLSGLKQEDKVGWISQIQHLGANASWMLGHWNEMEEFIDPEYSMSDNHVLENNTSFYGTILAIKHRDYSKALSMVKEIRSTLSENIGFSLGQNYSRAKRGMVSMQVLAEIEEVVEYSQVVAKLDADAMGVGIDQKNFDVTTPAQHSSDIDSKKQLLLSKWQGRFKWVPKEVKVYRQILAVHTLVAEPLEDLESWLELVTLCRKERKFNLCENILRRLGAPLGTDEATVDDDPRAMRVLFSFRKYQHDIGEKEAALQGLLRLAHSDVESTDTKMRLFQSICLLKSAEWMRGDQERYPLTLVLDTVREARDLATDNYRVWHAWALLNYMQLQQNDWSEDGLHTKSSSNKSTESDYNDERVGKGLRRVHSHSGASLANLASTVTDSSGGYVIEAIKGFSRSLTLSHDQPIVNVLQDTLRLLTLWFTYGSAEEVFEVLTSEIEKVSADNWIGVLPQMIARMHVTTPEITGLLKKLLIKIAVSHPQSIVCPILVSYNTADAHQKAVAAAVIQDMRLKHNTLVDEATMVSNELMRVAITPHELWNDGLEKAAKYYVTDRNLSGMMSVLVDLHKSLDLSGEERESADGFIEGISKVGFTTLRDVSFRHSYSRDLAEAYEFLMKFNRTARTTDLHQAWDLYHKVFKRISAQLKTFKNVHLNHVSPALCSASNLQLAVPGTYKVSHALTTISSFSTAIDVIASKQRPRKLTVLGSDGNNYHFLLKGNEDLRQDERVMQLFGLINACLENDRSTRSRALGIVRYSVLPLSNNSGVIGWVENCDTLNQLIREYRLSKDLKVNIEARLKMSKAPDYDKLTLLQKVDIFRQVQDETTGQDLAKMLWLKSKSSDVWVERRANYTTSLAVMSMVGYILGLGDRHPSNLMLDRISGRIVHIDFGDCFEVSMQRAVLPETVPFRLTRMMITAMEASGIQGTYRFTCNRVMSVLRSNKDSVMAMLEAFVYDPLISWRLLVLPKYDFDKMENPDAEVNDSNIEVGPQATALQGASSVEGARLLDDSSEPYVEVAVPKSLAVAASMAAAAGRRLSKALSMSDSERKSLDAYPAAAEDSLNARAMEVIRRIHAKLTGTDFGDLELASEEQIDRLISEATSTENLCQLFAGWCSLW